jgi:membrane associated rhomboid family serine protease
VILPLGDSPNPRGVPFVTYALIAANIAVFALISVPLSGTPADPRDPSVREYVRVVLEHGPEGLSPQTLLQQISLYDLFVFQHGFRPAAPRLDALFFSLFLHAGLMHLVGNMLFLWIYGDNVEHAMGRGRYLIAYLATGIGATLFHMVFDAASELPLIGASGAISGVLGFYFLWFPHNQVRLLLFLFPFLFNTVTVSARLLLGMYLVADNLIPFLFTRATGGGVAYGAHIGGFLGGLAVAWLSDRRELNQRPKEYAAAAVPKAATSDLEALVDSGAFAEAARSYFAMSPNDSRGVLSPEASLRLAEWLRTNGHDRAALIAYRRHLRDYAQDATAADAHLGAGLVQLDAFGQPTAAYQHFLDALESSPSPAVAAQARSAIGRITARQGNRWRPA